MFYFSGHGSIAAEGGGSLVSEDCKDGEIVGISMMSLIKLANNSKARNKIIVLDTCYSGFVGSHQSKPELSFLGDGVTIMTASSREQTSIERYDLRHGLFTNLFLQALQGSAASIAGEVTPGAIYSFIDKSLGNLEQRPVFKTNTSSFISLRQTSPTVQKSTLRKLKNIFNPNYAIAK